MSDKKAWRSKCDRSGRSTARHWSFDFCGHTMSFRGLCQTSVLITCSLELAPAFGLRLYSPEIAAATFPNQRKEIAMKTEKRMSFGRSPLLLAIDPQNFVRRRYVYADTDFANNHGCLGWIAGSATGACNAFAGL